MVETLALAPALGALTPGTGAHRIGACAANKLYKNVKCQYDGGRTLALGLVDGYV